MEPANTQTPKNQPELFQILSFDGGGLKGLFPAALLAEIENDLGKSVADHFDLIVGTSTGGLIALGLGAGMTPADIRDFYTAHGGAIFGSGRGRLRSMFRAKHDSGHLRSALTEAFGERTLGTSGKRLVVPSYSVDRNDVYLFKTAHHERLTRDHRETFVDVAMATTAAPTFLPAFHLRNNRLIDGGIWADNPALVGVAEAVSMLGIPLDRIRVLSLGTTDEVTAISDQVTAGGWAPWAKEIVPVLQRAQALGSFHAAQHLVGPDNVSRIDLPVPSGLFGLDDVDERRIRSLAEDLSRDACPTVRTFTTHIAPIFTPYNHL